MGHLQLESDAGSYCNKLRDLLSYSRRFRRVKWNLPLANVCSRVYRKRQLYMFSTSHRKLEFTQRP